MGKENYEIYQDKLIQDAKRQPKMCFFCCVSDYRINFEKHHILGKMNSGDTVLACPNCHNIITYKQNRLPPYMRKKNAPKLLELLFGLRTIDLSFQLLFTKRLEIYDLLCGEWKRCQKQY